MLANDEEIVKLLLKHGADPLLQDEEGFTLLSLAAQNGHLNIVMLLTENSIHVDMYRIKKAVDWTPIMHATKNGHTEIVKYFVEKGADIHWQKKDGVTVFHLASYKGRIDLVEYFCQNSQIDVNIQDENGVTPLMYAAKVENIDVAKILLQKSADIHIPDYDMHWTAPFCTLKGEHEDLFRYFLCIGLMNLDHRVINGNSTADLSLVLSRSIYRSMEVQGPQKVMEHKLIAQKKDSEFAQEDNTASNYNHQKKLIDVEDN